MTYEFKAAQGKQVRTVHAELRDTGDEFALIGYASVFNTLSHNLGGFREKITPGTFARSIRTGADVKCLFNHAPDNILGRTKSGTLTLSEDAHGLKFRCQLNRNSQAHRDLYAAVQRKDIDEMSFAFSVPDGGQSWAAGKDPESGEDCAMRTISNVDLIDVSCVTYPAYPNTGADARAQRSLPDYIPAATQIEQLVNFRKLARAGALVHDLIVRKSPYPEPYDYRALDEMCCRAMELCEAAFAVSDDIDDTLDEWDDSTRNVAVFHKAMRAAHAQSHAAISGASEAFARTRLALARCMKK